MATEDIIQDLISALGQSQPERVAAEIADHYVDLDERTPEDRLLFTRALSAYVRHYQADLVAARDFTPFFPFGAPHAPGDAAWSAAARADAQRLLDGSQGDAPPHLAILGAFLALHERPRTLLNSFSARHRDFYYRDVLRFKPRAPVPDQAHVVLELKKGAKPVRIGPSVVFAGGKDQSGVVRLYQPVREVVVSAARVADVCSTFVDTALHAAPVARSVDGVGGPLPEGDPGWAPFGSAEMPPGAVGFAVSSPVLRLAGGARQITLTLSLASGGGAGLDKDALAASLEAFVTGEKGWLGPYALTAFVSGDQLQFGVTLSEGVAAVTDHQSSVHGETLAADAPALQLVMKEGAPLAYRTLAGRFVKSARVSVSVTGLGGLTLEGERGPLDAKRTFLPFGPEADKGASFFIGCPEALEKTLTKLSLTVSWHGLPASFVDVYNEYEASFKADSFKATARYRDGTGQTQTAEGIALFPGGAGEIPLTPGAAPAVEKPTPLERIYALRTAAHEKASLRSLRFLAMRPMLRRSATGPAPLRAGFISLSLDRGFLHDTYRRVTLTRAGSATKENPFVPLPEPYTPAIAALSLSYDASTPDVDLSVATVDAFASRDLRFFHVDVFGQRREHAYLRAALPHVTDTRIPLLPGHPDEGELLVGLTGLGPQDGISLLVEVAEGSADPELVWPKVSFSVLADNHWKPLGPGELVLDTTSALRRSGLVVITVPREATTQNTLLPPGRLWLKAAVPAGAAGVSRLVDVVANGVLVQFADHGNAPSHLAAPLPAGSLAKLKTPVPTVKAVRQPEASFGGRPAEPLSTLTTRASERLRHKGRALTPWDYERLVLDAFPAIHRVKCVPHAKRGVWRAPGHVLLVVVPDLHNKNSRDPLTPRAAPDTLAQIGAYVSARAGMGVAVEAVNPTYARVRLDFQVKLHAGVPFTTYGPLLAKEITDYLSPWASDAETEVAFGGHVYKSAVLDFVERREYVDYLEVFRMFVAPGAGPEAEVDEGRPAAPDVILTSAAAHVITEVA